MAEKQFQFKFQVSRTGVRIPVKAIFSNGQSNGEYFLKNFYRLIDRLESHHKKLPRLGFEPQTWKRGNRTATAYCFTQSSNGCSLGSFLFPRQGNHVQRCTCFWPGRSTGSFFPLDWIHQRNFLRTKVFPLDWIHQRNFLRTKVFRLDLIHQRNFLSTEVFCLFRAAPTLCKKQKSSLNPRCHLKFEFQNGFFPP